MQQKFLKDLNEKEKFEGYLMVKSAEQRLTKEEKSYVDMNLADKSGEINAKNWDTNASAPNVGEIIKIKGTIIDYRGRSQLKVESMSSISREELKNLDLSSLIKCAPYDPQGMLDKIRKVANSIKSNDLKAICNAMLDEFEDELLFYPAAKEMHHAEKSGLLHHIYSMLHVASSLNEVYPWINWDLVNAGIIMHDLAKITEMESDCNGLVKDYTKDGNLVGHLVRGVVKIQQVADRLNISGETVELLQHMIISHHGIAEYGSPRPPMFPEALILHFIDDLDAKLYQFKSELELTESGSFTGYVRSLDRRLYKPIYDELK